MACDSWLRISHMVYQVTCQVIWWRSERCVKERVRDKWPRAWIKWRKMGVRVQDRNTVSLYIMVHEGIIPVCQSSPKRRLTWFRNGLPMTLLQTHTPMPGWVRTPIHTARRTIPFWVQCACNCRTLPCWTGWHCCPQSWGRSSTQAVAHPQLRPPAAASAVTVCRHLVRGSTYNHCHAPKVPAPCVDDSQRQGLHCCWTLLAWTSQLPTWYWMTTSRRTPLQCSCCRCRHCHYHCHYALGSDGGTEIKPCLGHCWYRGHVHIHGLHIQVGWQVLLADTKAKKQQARVMWHSRISMSVASDIHLTLVWMRWCGCLCK